MEVCASHSQGNIPFVLSNASGVCSFSICAVKQLHPQHLLNAVDIYFSCTLFLCLSPVDQSMFENSTAQQQSPKTSRSGLSSAQRPPASANPNPGPSSADTSYSGGQQRLKNAINLGKAVGAKVSATQKTTVMEVQQVVQSELLNRYLAFCIRFYSMNAVRKHSFLSFSLIQVNDLLRRKEPSHLGDIGVTEVNKSVGASWSCMDQAKQTTNRYSAVKKHLSPS